MMHDIDNLCFSFDESSFLRGLEYLLCCSYSMTLKNINLHSTLSCTYVEQLYCHLSRTSYTFVKGARLLVLMLASIHKNNNCESLQLNKQQRNGPFHCCLERSIAGLH